MKTLLFQSSLAPALEDLLQHRQALRYNDGSFCYLLRHFDRYLVSVGWQGTELTRKIVHEWASSGAPRSPKTRARRIGAMRALGRFLSETIPETYIPGRLYGTKSAFRSYIYTTAEIQALLTETGRLGPVGSIRPKTFVTLFSLLYATGLRRSEALRLTLSDVDLENGILVVRESKFCKSRLVPLHPSTTEALRQYHRICDEQGHDRDAPFLLDRRGRACTGGSLSHVFLSVARRAGLRGPVGTPGPRLHDLRHTFAVHRLLAWYRDGGDVQSRLPLLSTYMGHVSIASTQVYLEATAELLQEAASRFQPPSLTKPSSAGDPS